MSNDNTTLNVDAMATQTAEPDLLDRMRRLSVGSSTSSYSLISEAPSVLSLDTNGSVNGGVSINAPTIEVLEPCLEALTTADDKLDSSIYHEANTSLAAPTHTSDQEPDVLTKDTQSQSPSPYTSNQDPDELSTEPQPPSPSPFWLQFPGFDPAPTSPFKQEFARLSKHQKWTQTERREQQVKALAAEIAHHYGTHLNKLDRWQQLCEDVGIDVAPKSVTQCRKIMSPVMVNLYNVLDHRRNPEVKVLRFRSYGQFVRYTRVGHKFPRECAKGDGLLNVFLRKI
ncbi:hypothetical protein HBI26_188880 [Parastagonospora nodorum]|nr:hypothetical protein HBH52_142850 [Parastagonospora nodorum]KAH4004191.1 hypothetical protein HBI10_049760 [Parastagonospora nodorum]KAH4018484.1 hypothetical protein HBI13_133360 [Parastagonospora nodorum]KAH4055636.1 hypothetical protein HBH49_061730 [Parastagonospora nodorum]KAH4072063.1 hypothetical protein HBH50_072140 [Parastagonospora nodorum]